MSDTKENEREWTDEELKEKYKVMYRNSDDKRDEALDPMKKERYMEEEKKKKQRKNILDRMIKNAIENRKKQKDNTADVGDDKTE